MNFKPVVLLLCLTGVCNRVQSSWVNVDESLSCHPPRLSLALDSMPTQCRLALDSVTRLAVGHWQLTEIRGGWSGASKPSAPVELQLNGQLEGALFEGGRRALECKFTLSTRYGYVRTTIDGQGASFFNLSPKVKGSFRVCDQKLVISQYLGDGLAFHFKKML